jgi:hypothetical protein
MLLAFDLRTEMEFGFLRGFKNRLYPVADFSKKQAKKWPKVLKIAYF